MKNNLLVAAIAILILITVGTSVYSETFSFTNSNPFIFSVPTVASTIPVTGVVGNVLDVNVTLSGMSIDSVSNGIEQFDVLLVGPQGTKIILISFVCDNTPGPVDFTLDDSAPSSLPPGHSGISCESGTYKPTDHSDAPGGGGYILDVPPAPPPPYSTNLSDLNGLDPNGTWTIWAEEFLGDEDGTIESWTITIVTDSVEACLKFNDEFDNDVVDWNVIKPNAVESGGNTVLIPSNKKGEIEAKNVFPGCSGNCILNTSFQSLGGSGSKIWVLGWYVDKHNLIELLFREDKNRITIRQRINRTVVRKSSANFSIDPNTQYSTTMIYDGTTITVLINGNSLGLTLAPVGNITGSVGLRSTNTSSTFTHMCVD